MNDQSTFEADEAKASGAARERYDGTSSASSVRSGDVEAETEAQFPILDSAPSNARNSSSSKLRIDMHDIIMGRNTGSGAPDSAFNRNSNINSNNNNSGSKPR